MTALQNGKLAGAALDVQDSEPPDLSQPLFGDPRRSDGATERRSPSVPLSLIRSVTPSLRLGLGSSLQPAHPATLDAPPFDPVASVTYSNEGAPARWLPAGPLPHFPCAGSSHGRSTS
ncbi:MAG: hypothetical protein L0211_02985 [Planctomycetaceae bacterium]|nr:hypothetical protein [Planctomycetaceae bacterium]